jgi:hypothetical protein
MDRFGVRRHDAALVLVRKRGKSGVALRLPPHSKKERSRIGMECGGMTPLWFWCESGGKAVSRCAGHRDQVKRFGRPASFPLPEAGGGWGILLCYRLIHFLFQGPIRKRRGVE